MAALQASLSFTVSWSLLQLMSIESGMLSNHLILWAPFSFYLQSFPASGSFPMSQLFTSSGHSSQLQQNCSGRTSFYYPGNKLKRRAEWEVSGLPLTSFVLNKHFDEQKQSWNLNTPTSSQQMCFRHMWACVHACTHSSSRTWGETLEIQQSRSGWSNGRSSGLPRAIIFMT